MFLEIEKSIEPVKMTVEEDSEYEQIGIPDLKENVRESVITTRMVSVDMFKERECIIKYQQGPGQYDILLLHDKKTLRDFAKYLMIEDLKRMSKDALAKELFSYISENPLHLLPALSFSAIRTLLAFMDKKEQSKVILDADNIDDYVLLLRWGLLSARIVKKEGKLYFAVAIPEEVQKNVVPVLLQLKKQGISGEQIAGYLEPERTYNLKKLYNSYNELLIKVREILLMYGAMKEEEMYQVFADLISSNCEKDDFFRFVYLYGTFHEKLTTGMNRFTKQRYIGHSADVLEYYFDKEDTDITQYYRYKSYEKLKKALEEGMDLLSPLFELLMQWELYPEEMERLISGYHTMAAVGCSLNDMMDSILEEFDLGLVDMAVVWRQLVIVCLQYPSYLMKGYSRLQAEQEFGRERYRGMFEASKKVKLANAMIHELPEDFQQQLADMVLLSKQGMIEEVIEQRQQIEGKYRSNPVVNTVIVMNIVEAWANLPKGRQQWESEVYDYAKEWFRGEKNVNEMTQMLDWCEDLMGLSGLQQFMPQKSDRTAVMHEEMDSFYWDEMEPVMQPIVKAEKIYPNAPCPCGSGKKYKKCCGKRA